TPQQGKMKLAPMNAQDDVIATPDRPPLVMVEMPIDALELACALILVGQGVIHSQVDGQGLAGVVALEVAEDQFSQREANVVGIPGADAEEIGEVAGIDARQFEASELGERLASGSHAEAVGEACDGAKWGGGQGQAQAAEEGDDRRGTPYNRFHGASRSGKQQR